MRALAVLCFIRRLWALHRASSSVLGPVVPSLRALSGRMKFTVRHHKFNKILSLLAARKHPEGNNLKRFKHFHPKAKAQTGR